jgi:hypothetical protein
VDSSRAHASRDGHRAAGQGSRVMAEFLERHDIRAVPASWARQNGTTVVSVPDLNGPRAIRA